MTAIGPTQIASAPKDGRMITELDESLFERIGEGHREALSELYYSTEAILYAYILSLTRNHHDACDILQDTYIKVRSAAHLYEPRGKPLAWMFTIAKNLYRNQMRLQRREMVSAAADVENMVDVSYVSNPDNRLVLEVALQVLTEEERQIVLLHTVTGMKHREIAGNLGLPLSTSLSKYYRSLKKLRSHLRKAEDAHG